MNFSTNEINIYLESVDKQLKEGEKIKFKYSIDWANRNFKDTAAIYALFDNGVLKYIGQTASLLKRMKDLRRTYNHSFRKKIGIKQFKTKPNKKGVFSELNESKLNTYFEENIEITFFEINFGRLEAESYLIHKNKGDNSDLLFNKIGVRDLI